MWNKNSINIGDLYLICEDDLSKKYILVVGFGHESVEVTACYIEKNVSDELKYCNTFYLTEIEVLCVGQFEKNVYDRVHV
tara:strand:+ start:949 stop:1188 length:240 start_codon:yes stop_codon:yes gene_type:complete